MITTWWKKTSAEDVIDEAVDVERPSSNNKYVNALRIRDEAPAIFDEKDFED